MKNRAFGSSLPLLGYAFFVAALFLFIRGYQFNTDDQAEHLPQIYQMLQPELYPNDYFVNASNSVFTVRYYYEKLVLLIAKTTGLEWGLFWFTFLCAAVMAYSFARIAQLWFSDRWSVLLAPILAMIVFYNFTVGGNHVMYGSFISSTIAKAIGSIGLLQFVSRRIGVSGLLLGMSTLFQPLVGLQLFIILTCIQIVFDRTWKSATGFVLCYSAIALFILVPTIGRQFSAAGDYDKELYYQVLYSFRNHHHFLPHLFPITHYIKLSLLIGLGTLSYYISRPQDGRFYLKLVAISLFGIVVYTVALEVLHVNAIGKTQWFKATIWLQAFSSLMVAGLVGQLLSGFVSIGGFQPSFLFRSLVAGAALLLAITNSRYLPESYQFKYMVGNRIKSDLEQMHDWIAVHTPVDANVLVSPTNNAFACQAKRGMPIHFQAIVHEPFFMLPWYRDFAEIYGVSIDNLEGRDARAHAAKLYATRNYTGNRKPIDYRLDDISTCEFVNELGPAVHKQGNWVLTEYVAR